MESLKHLTPFIAVAPQLQPGDMGMLAAAGFRSVINNRPDGEEPGQPTSPGFRIGRHIDALPADRAGFRAHQKGKRAQQRGLAAAVAANQRQNLAGGQAEGQALNHLSAATAAGEIGDLEKRRRHRSPSYHERRGGPEKKKAALSGENERTAEAPPKRLERGFGGTTFRGDTQLKWKSGMALARPK